MYLMSQYIQSTESPIHHMYSTVYLSCAFPCPVGKKQARSQAAQQDLKTDSHQGSAQKEASKVCVLFVPLLFVRYV